MNAVAQPFADVRTQARYLVNLVARDGGATIWRTGDVADLTGKHVVGGVVKGAQFSIPAGIGPVHTTLVDSVAAWMQALPTKVDLIGGWVDAGIFYVDAVDTYVDKRDALDVARERGEIAIFDNDAFESIYVADHDILVEALLESMAEEAHAQEIAEGVSIDADPYRTALINVWHALTSAYGGIEWLPDTVKEQYQAVGLFVDEIGGN